MRFTSAERFQGNNASPIYLKEVAMRTWAFIIPLTVLAAWPALAQQQSSIPDLRGTWKGESESIVMGGANPHHTGQPQDGPRLSSASFTFTVDKQDGRRVSGTWTSPRSTEPVIGVISRTGTFLCVDTDGHCFGTLLAPDRLEMCYVQTGQQGRVASCTEMKKQP
jgi:hypothetical protein